MSGKQVLKNYLPCTEIVIDDCRWIFLVLPKNTCAFSSEKGRIDITASYGVLRLFPISLRLNPSSDTTAKLPNEQGACVGRVDGGRADWKTGSDHERMSGMTLSQILYLL